MKSTTFTTPSRRAGKSAKASAALGGDENSKGQPASAAAPTPEVAAKSSGSSSEAGEAAPAPDALPGRLPAGTISTEQSVEERREPALEISAKVEGFRRGGMAHSKAATIHALSKFTPDQVEQLLAEPNLTVKVV